MSWLRARKVRVSLSMAACEGVPLTHGSRSAESPMPGRGQLGEHRVQRRARLRGEIPTDRRHSVDILVTDGDAAPPRAADFAVVAVGVQVVGEGRPAWPIVGAVPAGQPG